VRLKVCYLNNVKSLREGLGNEDSTNLLLRSSLRCSDVLLAARLGVSSVAVHSGDLRRARRCHRARSGEAVSPWCPQETTVAVKRRWFPLGTI
jgi:hypothetical protein